MFRPILVTGAAGFIAFHLIERLLNEGYEVYGIDCFDTLLYSRIQKEQNLADLQAIAAKTRGKLHFQELNILNIDPKWMASKRIDAIVHLAGKPGVRPSIENPEAYDSTNVHGTLHLLEATRAAGIGNFVFGSSSSVYGDTTAVPFREDAVADRPISPYAASKRAGELYCATFAHLYGMKVAALRFFTVYGPRQRPDLAIHKFSRLIFEGKKVPFFGDGETSRDYTFVTDIIQGVRAAIDWVPRQAPGSYEVFNLGGNRTTSLKRLVELLEQNLGKKAVLEKLPRQPGDVERTFADLTKSSKVLGYEPTTSIEEGIERFSKWILSEYSSSKKNAA